MSTPTTIPMTTLTTTMSSTVRPLAYHIISTLINIRTDGLIAPPPTPYLAPVPLPDVVTYEISFEHGLTFLYTPVTFNLTTSGLHIGDYVQLDTCVDPELYISLATQSFFIA